MISSKRAAPACQRAFNAPGCNSQEEVEEACGIVLVDEVNDVVNITMMR